MHAVLGESLCGPLLAGALASSAGAQTTKRISIMIMSDTPQLVEVKDGLLKGLKERGYDEGKNLKVDFKSAQANFGTAQQIARQFVGDAPDVIVPITTPDKPGCCRGDQRTFRSCFRP